MPWQAAVEAAGGPKEGSWGVAPFLQPYARERTKGALLGGIIRLSGRALDKPSKALGI